MRRLTHDEVARQIADLPVWRRDGDELVREVTLPDFPAAIAFVVAVADEAEELDHHPDIDVRWRTVTLRITTHSAGGLTQLDIEFAHRVEELIVDRG